MDSLVVIWEGLTAAVVMSDTIFRIHKKRRSLHGADYKRNEEFHHVVYELPDGRLLSFLLSTKTNCKRKFVYIDIGFIVRAIITKN